MQDPNIPSSAEKQEQDRVKAITNEEFIALVKQRAQYYPDFRDALEIAISNGNTQKGNSSDSSQAPFQSVVVPTHSESESRTSNHLGKQAEQEQRDRERKREEQERVKEQVEQGRGRREEQRRKRERAERRLHERRSRMWGRRREGFKGWIGFIADLIAVMGVLLTLRLGQPAEAPPPPPSPPIIFVVQSSEGANLPNEHLLQVTHQISQHYPNLESQIRNIIRESR